MEFQQGYRLLNQELVLNKNLSKKKKTSERLLRQFPSAEEKDNFIMVLSEYIRKFQRMYRRNEKELESYKNKNACYNIDVLNTYGVEESKNFLPIDKLIGNHSTVLRPDEPNSRSASPDTQGRGRKNFENLTSLREIPLNVNGPMGGSQEDLGESRCGITQEWGPVPEGMTPESWALSNQLETSPRKEANRMKKTYFKKNPREIKGDPKKVGFQTQTPDLTRPTKSPLLNDNASKKRRHSMSPVKLEQTHGNVRTHNVARGPNFTKKAANKRLPNNFNTQQHLASVFDEDIFGHEFMILLKLVKHCNAQAEKNSMVIYKYFEDYSVPEILKLSQTLKEFRESLNRNLLSVEKFMTNMKKFTHKKIKLTESQSHGWNARVEEKTVFEKGVWQAVLENIKFSNAFGGRSLELEKVLKNSALEKAGQNVPKPKHSYAKSVFNLDRDTYHKKDTDIVEIDSQNTKDNSNTWSDADSNSPSKKNFRVKTAAVNNKSIYSHNQPQGEKSVRHYGSPDSALICGKILAQNCRLNKTSSKGLVAGLESLQNKNKYAQKVSNNDNTRSNLDFFTKSFDVTQMENE
jgi:hypothetical protein